MNKKPACLYMWAFLLSIDNIKYLQTKCCLTKALSYFRKGFGVDVRHLLEITRIIVCLSVSLITTHPQKVCYEYLCRQFAVQHGI